MGSSRLKIGPESQATRGVLVAVGEAVGESAFGAYPLPFKDTITIGRGSDNDVAIDDVSISREHAAIHFGDSVWIEDLGSTNGTRVREPMQWVADIDTGPSARERRLEPRERVQLVSGSIVMLGSLMLMFQFRPSHGRPRRLWPHALFEDRVQEECARATARERSTFAILRIRLMSQATGDDRYGGDTAQLDERMNQPALVKPTYAEAVRETSEEVLAAVMRPSDVIAIDDDGEYDVLLAHASVAETEALAKRLKDAYGRRGLAAHIGVACYPRDGRSPEALLLRASERISSGEAPAALPSKLVVRDPQMIALYELTERVANSDVTVLLLGETGVGKEVLAERIHVRSPRKQGPLVRINCAAVPDTLLEGELFGYERGAFTGADKAKEGLFETAHNGTLFLDEIGEIPPATQAKLLRVLEDRKVMRLGARAAKQIDVRIIAATNRDLEHEVAAGRFRGDLYFRLHVFPLEIPPLRERPSEIQALAESFLTTLCAQMGRSVPELSTTAASKLRAYAWPGNIRELRNVVQRALLLCRGDVITEAHLPVERMGRTIATRRDETSSAVAMAAPGPPQSRARAVTVPPTIAQAPDLRTSVEDLEKDRILAALEECAGNQTRAAKLLGITRKVLLSRLDRYGLPRPRK